MPAANSLVSYLAPWGLLYLSGSEERKRRYRNKETRRWGLLAATVFLASLVFAQGSPRVTGVEPSSGKVNDNVTVMGENLGKDAVSAVFLSDDKDDHQATVVEQAAARIILKVPQVKPGDYNVSIQVGDKILIEPVRFKVQPSNPAPGK
jgi:IPT/TIG domain